ncbi:MAG: ATP-binding protein [Chitinivibrionales bacterium]|nr:ATP-binding protein [Chitinivibrionales bacterium]
MFIGREKELQQLQDLFSKSGSSLVICRGRRRIGKSSLIDVFGKTATRFYQFQGLPPREGISEREQLASFSQQLTRQTKLPKMSFESWSQAFSFLASIISNEKTVLLLDEISWIATGAPDFSGYLKIAWDTEFKKKNRLVLVLCGSISSWIEKNILNNTGFVGRVSLTLSLDELSLPACNEFWLKNRDRIDSCEKLKLLSVTGGVPRYLEEIRPSLTAEENIRRMCFLKEGFLFNEFDQIFHDIFSRRSSIYREIVSVLATGSKQNFEISKLIDWERGGHLSEYLRDLELSGFITKDTVFGTKNGKVTRHSKYRLSDNYLRFYLKCIAPHVANIKKGLYNKTPLDEIIAWETILGYQFENLVLKNLPLLLPFIGIQPSVVKAASPYFQRNTNRKKACQIDLLIHTKHSLYLCEIKAGTYIGAGIIDEVKEKTLRLVVPKGISIRTVLIYEGDLEQTIQRQGYFDFIVPFQELLIATN